MSARCIFNGVIFSDLGEAGRFMALEWVQAAIERELGFEPFPATLNLRPKEARDAAVWAEVRAHENRIDLLPAQSGFCAAALFAVIVTKPGADDPGVRAAVLLPAVGAYPGDKIEVIAPVRLKDRFGVRDGDPLTLEFIH
jgi:riboflavin kinase